MYIFKMFTFASGAKFESISETHDENSLRLNSSSIVFKVHLIVFFKTSTVRGLST